MWLTSGSIAATSTCNPSLKVFGLDRLAGLELNSLAAKRVNTHQDKVIILALAKYG